MLRCMYCVLYVSAPLPLCLNLFIALMCHPHVSLCVNYFFDDHHVYVCTCVPTYVLCMCTLCVYVCVLCVSYVYVLCMCNVLAMYVCYALCYSCVCV